MRQSMRYISAMRGMTNRIRIRSSGRTTAVKRHRGFKTIAGEQMLLIDLRSSGGLVGDTPALSASKILADFPSRLLREGSRSEDI